MKTLRALIERRRTAAVGRRALGPCIDRGGRGYPSGSKTASQLDPPPPSVTIRVGGAVRVGDGKTSPWSVLPEVDRETYERGYRAGYEAGDADARMSK